MIHGEPEDGDPDAEQQGGSITTTIPPPTQHPSLTLVKTTVFVHTISQAGWNRFSSVCMLRHGFTPTQIGIVNSLSKVAKAMAQPLWGAASDAGDPLTAMIASTILGTATLMAVRTAIEARDVPSLIVWRGIRSAATAASPALDALVLRLVERTSEGYGRQRLWGSVAWGVSSLCAGTLLDRFHEGALFLYTYVANGMLLVFFLVLRSRIGSTGGHDKEHDRADAKSRGGTTFGRLVHSVRATLLDLVGGAHSFVLLHNFVYGAVMVLFDNILMLQLERDFGMTRSLQGMFTLVSISSTLPVYRYSHWLRERMGHVGMMQSSVLVAFLRLLLTKVACSGAVSADSRATWLLIIQLLHGYHFAANWTASVEMMDALAGRKQRSQMQFLLNLAYFTAGAGVGNLAWSSAYERRGAQETYTRGLALCVVDFLFVRLLHRYHCRHPRAPVGCQTVV